MSHWSGFVIRKFEELVIRSRPVSYAIFFLFFFFCWNNSTFSQYCYPNRFSNNEFFQYENIRASRDVVYGYSKNQITDSTEALMMDIYYPDMAVDTMTKRPFILLAHGGGFLFGSRHLNDYFCFELAKRGYVCATMDYRVGWCPAYTGDVCTECVPDSENAKVATYMAVQDVRAALRYMGANCMGWNVDPNYFFVGGTSAGAIAAFLAVIWTQQEANSFAPTAEGLCGNLDTAGNAFSKKYIIRGIVDQCGAIPGDSTLVNQIDVPLISFHDEFDCIVPSQTGTLYGCGCSAFYKCYGSTYIHNGLFTNGTCSELNLVLNSSDHCTFPNEMVMLRTACFFKRVMCNECRSDTNSNLTFAPNCDSLGMDQVFGVDDFSVSICPTPANDVVEMTFSEHSRHYGNIKFYNALGIEILEQPFPYMTKKIDLDVSRLPSGIYFLVFDYPEKITPIKMLVTHF